MKVTKFQDQAIKDTPHKIDVREMYNKETAQVMLMTLKPGEIIQAHKTSIDIFFFIVEGHPTIYIGDESVECEPKTVVESPAESMMSLNNKTDKVATILVVKLPHQLSLTKLL